LLEAYRSGRLHHAWLIAGQRGIGKATLAYRFARYVLRFPDGPPGEGSEHGLHVPSTDRVFRWVQAQAHPDLLVVRREPHSKSGHLPTEITIDTVRRIPHFFSRSAAEGGWRVCIIDAVDELNRNAANAILKVLEEPPRRSLLLLVAHHPERILGTIRSRCSRLNLQPLDPRHVVSVVGELAGAEAASDSELISLADGSIGRALAHVRGSAWSLFKEVREIVLSLPELDVPRVHALASTLAARGREDDLRQFTDLLTDWMALLIRSRSAGQEELLEPGDREIARRLIPDPPHAWVDAWDRLVQTVRQANALNLDRKQLVLNAIFMLERTARVTAVR